VLDLEVPDPDAQRIRTAGRDVLSLALIDARNHTLRWIAAFEQALGPELRLPESAAASFEPPLWMLGRIGWYAEHWIARNMQRQRGERADATHPKLGSIWPEADRQFGPASLEALRRGEHPPPALQTVRQYLVDTLETTLELLDTAAADDEALYFYRLALFHEDARREAFAVLAQALDLDTGLAGAPATPATQRPPLLFPATRWRLGSESVSGFVFENEKWAHEIALPEFEIDAQPVSWAQFCEFVEDGGYDEPAHWNEAGWAWLLRETRRTPRYVDQMRQGVLQRRFGKLVRVPLAQPVLHLAWYEADAWCRWAGRRLPSEVEWEAAAGQGATRGFRWGDITEWAATTLRPYPGYPGEPGRAASEAEPDPTGSAAAFSSGGHKAVRGASFATAPRLRHPKRRSFALPERDAGFVGFRSCAI
jgi:ergothioneine biosynthesis protein EgtB